VKLDRLTSDTLQKGMVVVHFGQSGIVRVGRIQSEITRHPLSQALATGIIAECDLLYADQHGEAENLIWQNISTGTRRHQRTQACSSGLT
jgi:hypothetical protein